MVNYLKRHWRDLGALFALIGIWIILSSLSDRFLQWDNIANIVRQVAVIYVIAVGATFVILTEGIDLSCGSVLGLSGMVMAMTMSRIGMGPAIAVALGIGAAAGAMNGYLISARSLPPFIATLGMMTVARGLTYGVSGGRAASDLPVAFAVIGGPGAASILIALACFVLGTLVLSQTRFGRHIYAVGSNELAAHLSGIRVRRIKFSVYMIAGLFAGLGGVMLTSRLMSAQSEAGLGYELQAIAATVIGGTRLAGGKGGVAGTLIGALILGTIQNGLNLLKVSSFWQLAVVGAVVIAAASLDVSLNKDRR
jgi:ribose/xylose/arabinose/galactoside ABC-type transport system permease subunit